jgi:primosomal protein N'
MYTDQWIAEVYPIQRLPRRFSVFDYLVPERLACKVGQMVRVPFRHRDIFAVMAGIKKKHVDVKKLKFIKTAVEEIRLNDTEIRWYEHIAQDTLQSIPSILHAALPIPDVRITSRNHEEPPLVPLKIRSSEASTILRLLTFVEGHRRAFVHTLDIVQMTAVIQTFLHTHPQERVAIFTPNIREAEWIARTLPYQLSFITGDGSSGERFLAWERLRAKKTRILVGTRRGAFVMPATMDTIFVLRSGHPNHKQSDRNPRIDVRRVISELADRSGARLYFLDAAPRADDVDRFGRTQVFFQHPITVKPIFIDLHAVRATSPHPFLSSVVYDAMTETLANHKRVICLYPRKGKARALHCRDCGGEFPCQVCQGRFTVYETTIQCHHCGCVLPLPLSCPTCAGHNLVQEGYGNRTMQQVFTRFFPTSSVSLIEKNAVGDPAADILLVTPYYLESIYNPNQKPERVGIVAHLDADAPLYDTSFRSCEQAVLRVEEMRGIAYRCQAPLLVQTHVPEMFARFYESPETFYEEELALRRAYAHPPITRRMRLVSRTKDAHRARLELDAIRTHLRGLSGVTILPTRPHDPSPTINVSVTQNACESLLNFLKTLPDHIMIDTDVSV